MDLCVDSELCGEAVLFIRLYYLCCFWMSWVRCNVGWLPQWAVDRGLVCWYLWTWTV
jgi:hypothetical protein